MDYDDEDDMYDDMEEDDGHWVHANAPGSLNGLRACIPCLLVKTYRQFLEEGCENCAKAFELKDDEAKIADVTTPNFEGLAAITQPNKSWVAEWQFTKNFIPGVYAIKVKGELSAAAEQELEEAEMPNIGKMLQHEAQRKPL